MREQQEIHVLCRLKSSPAFLGTYIHQTAWWWESRCIHCNAYALLSHFTHKTTQAQIHTTSAGGKLSHGDVYEHVLIQWVKPTTSPHSHKVCELRSLVCRWALSTSENLQLWISAEEFTPGICRKRNHFNIKLQLRRIMAALKSYCWKVLSYRPLLAYNPTTQCFSSVACSQKSHGASATCRVSSLKCDWPLEHWSMELVGNSLYFLNFPSFSLPCNKQKKHWRYPQLPAIFSGTARAQICNHNEALDGEELSRLINQ